MRYHCKTYSMFSRPSFSSANLTLNSITSALVSSWVATTPTMHDLTLFRADSHVDDCEDSANSVAWLRMWLMNLGSGTEHCLKLHSRKQGSVSANRLGQVRTQCLRVKCGPKVSILDKRYNKLERLRRDDSLSPYSGGHGSCQWLRAQSYARGLRSANYSTTQAKDLST